MSPPPIDRTRRRLLLAAPAAVACGVVGDGASSGCGILGGSGDAGFDAGAPAMVGDVAVGMFYSPPLVGAGSYVLGRDADGFYAFSNTCTHQGCGLPKPDASGQVVCPCHGSVYNSNGDILVGHDGSSAVEQASLKHLRVSFMGTGPSAVVIVDVTREETDRTARVQPT